MTGKEIIDKINIFNKYLDEIEDFLEEYDEETGLAGCSIDYDDAISQLGSTLFYIKQHTR